MSNKVGIANLIMLMVVFVAPLAAEEKQAASTSKGEALSKKITERLKERITNATNNEQNIQAEKPRAVNKSKFLEDELLDELQKDSPDEEKLEMLLRLLADQPTPAPLPGPPPQLDYDPRLFFIGLGFSTTSRAVFADPFRTFRAGDSADNPTGKRYIELRDKKEVKFGSVLTFRLRYNARMINGERTLFDPPSRRIVDAARNEGKFWPAPLDLDRANAAMDTLKSGEEGDKAYLDDEAYLDKMNAALAKTLIPGGTVTPDWYAFEFFELSLDVYLDQDTGKSSLSQGLRSQAGLSLQGSFSPVGLHLLFTTLTEDGSSFEPTLSWSAGPGGYGWISTNFEFGVLQYLAGGGIEQNFIIPGFTSFDREVIVKDAAGNPKKDLAKGYRAAEVRLGVYAAAFNTPDIDERELAVSPTTTRRSSFVSVTKFGVPDYDDTLGMLVTVDVYLPLGAAAIIYTRANLLISREITTWEMQIGVTISLSDLAAVFK